jgi:hypothetical protein
MKKTLLVLIAMACICSLFCLQLPSVKAEETKTFIGKVESVKPRSTEGPYRKIEKVDPRGIYAVSVPFAVQNGA